jgi:hypothetical protein
MSRLVLMIMVLACLVVSNGWPMSAAVDSAGKCTVAVDTAKKAAVSYKTVNVKRWVFSYAIDGKNLVAKVSYPTRGWVAIGFGPSRKMEGANMVIGSVSEKGVVIKNHYGVSPVSHKAKADIGRKDCISDGNVTQKDGITTIFFTMPLNDGDPKDAVLVPGKEMPVIFAAGDAADITSEHSDSTKTKLAL